MVPMKSTYSSVTKGAPKFAQVRSVVSNAAKVPPSMLPDQQFLPLESQPNHPGQAGTMAPAMAATGVEAKPVGALKVLGSRPAPPMHPPPNASTTV